MKSLKQIILEAFAHNNGDNYSRYKLARKVKLGKANLYYDVDDSNKEIHDFLRNYNCSTYKINDDLTIDVDGDIDLDGYPESELPDYIQFGVVKGNFYIRKSKLVSLRGCPKEVGEDFSCSGSLDLKSLEGAPQKVGCFYCYKCWDLKSLEGAPQKVSGNFNCSECENLESLKGAPRYVDGHFSCAECGSLTSLKGAPQKVGGDFDCEKCKKLGSLDYVPRKVGGEFDCRGTKFSKEDVRELCDVGKYIKDEY